MNSFDQVRPHINKQRLVETFLNAVDSYSPSYAESPAINVFSQTLQEMNIPYIIQPVPGNPGEDERANLLVRIGPEKSGLMLVGHVDTVSLWYEGSHRARVEGDLVYGLGTADMKSGCAAMLEAVCAVIESGVKLKKGVWLALVVGEEENGDGSMAIKSFASAPLTVIGEPTSLKLCTEHFSYYEYHLIAHGERAHAALPAVGKNAIHAMLTWLSAIIEEGKNRQVSVNPREIQGGDSSFAVPETCEAYVDFHFPAGLSVDEIETVLETSRIQTLDSHPQVELSGEQTLGAPGFYWEETGKMISPLRNAFEDVALDDEPTAFPSHSDASIYNNAGSVTVVCGPGDLAVAHRRDEHVSLTELEKAAHLYSAMICRTCA
jgi:acetylornithine deacetylase